MLLPVRDLPEVAQADHLQARVRPDERPGVGRVPADPERGGLQALLLRDLLKVVEPDELHARIGAGVRLLLGSRLRAWDVPRLDRHAVATSGRYSSSRGRGFSAAATL